jgi:hypothetical protein
MSAARDQLGEVVALKTIGPSSRSVRMPGAFRQEINSLEGDASEHLPDLRPRV